MELLSALQALEVDIFTGSFLETQLPVGDAHGHFSFLFIPTCEGCGPESIQLLTLLASSRVA